MQQFRQAIRQDDPDLLLACLAMAQGIAYPDLDMVRTAAKFNSLAERAGDHIDRRQHALDQTQELCEFLFVEQGFSGNEDNYYDADNSFLNAVLERKLGIPISLSALLLIVAEKLAIPAYGVGMPGHFIVGVNGPTRAYHFDPFHKGRPVSVADCAELVERITGHDGPFDPNWLMPVPTLTIIIRMLDNLRHLYLAQKQWGKTQRVIQHLRITVPERTELWRDEAVVALQQNKMARAHHCLEQYLKLAPNAPDAALLKQRMNPRLNEWVKLN